MGKMMIEIPDDRLVHVVVSQAGLAIADDRPRIADERLAPTRRRRPLLVFAGGVAVLVFGFVLGHQTLPSHAEADAQTASAVNVPAGAVPQALAAEPLPSPPYAPATPSLNPPTAPGAPAGQVPAALAQQLAQAPQVVPAPGQPQPAASAPAGAPPQKNPFGLGD